MARRLRSIPAHAGQPGMPHTFADFEAVYPRAMRGNPGQPDGDRPFRGSIPAHAGQPREAYNHARAAAGLSPRMRGNQPSPFLTCVKSRSIPAHAGATVIFFAFAISMAGLSPAHAGQPLKRTSISRNGQVYPRACGATFSTERCVKANIGLSPRMRGNPIQPRDVWGYTGSIPAHAGQPGTRDVLERTFAVYPRACGATSAAPVIASAQGGLSPRMRGQPAWFVAFVTASAVYPRACGATIMALLVKEPGGGLSPRMRGNHGDALRGDTAHRSIPAHAGQPAKRKPTPDADMVYPRACGATHYPIPSCPPVRGLSPRMRGNPPGARALPRHRGSIPAHAGQPALTSAGHECTAVYPRACGATSRKPIQACLSYGLSPRMRGNLEEARRADTSSGSIPAHAGQPT